MFTSGVVLASAYAAPTVQPPHHTAISLIGGIVFLVLAWLMKTRPFHKCEFLTPWFCLFGGIGLASTFFGDWIRTAVNWTTGLPYVGQAIPVVLGLVTLWIVVYDLLPKHPTTKLTGPAAIALPTVGTAIGGAVGAALTTIVVSLDSAGASAIAQAFGVG